MRLNQDFTTDPDRDPDDEDRELRAQAHSYAVDRDALGERQHQDASPICSGCKHQLTPGPWGSMICWHCDNVVYGAGGRE